MAGSSLLLLIDDLTTVLDDVAAMSKVAAKKTTGVLGDDLALNAQQVSGVRADRELPVVWAVAKGSFKNKLILVPSALGLSAFAPWSITPILMVGGAYLCYEGFEKIAHPFLCSKQELENEDQILHEAILHPEIDLLELEREKIKGAIRTDFVLSAEIIVIALGTVATQPLGSQAAVVSAIAVVMTVGVYGFVALIVKLDDMGLYLVQNAPLGRKGAFNRTLGNGLLSFAPKLMKTLTVVGTIAMFLVGGSILAHGIPSMHVIVESAVATAQRLPAIGGILGWLTPLLLDAVVGIVAGGVVMGIVEAMGKIVKVFKKQ
jgi:predicted DNA repair protein MutK